MKTPYFTFDLKLIDLVLRFELANYFYGKNYWVAYMVAFT